MAVRNGLKAWLVAPTTMRNSNAKPIRAMLGNTVIAESSNVKVVEGITYFPIDDVDQKRLRDSPTTSTCFWKGRARYFHVESDDDLATDAAFAYPKPWPLARRLVTDRIGFWREVEIVGERGPAA